MKTVKFFVLRIDMQSSEISFVSAHYTKKQAFEHSLNLNYEVRNFYYFVVNRQRLNQLEDRLNIDLLPF